MAETATADGLHAFAFQTGEWSVRHHKLKRRLVGETAWSDFPGACRAWELLGGAGNIDDHTLDDPNGAYTAATLRRLDPATGVWSIWWFDPRLTKIDPPLQGRFVDGVGTFYSDDELNGRPIKVRFIWSEITADHARWEQAFSPDQGRTWEVNWIMHFDRRR
ncbi:MAG TPA: DUF1579 domain-containing protein [Phenylobacterium sp.]